LLAGRVFGYYAGMKISTRARYGIRAMVELARRPEGATGRRIAENQHLPAAYLEQILARLRSANMVASIRGAKGKFVLTQKPETITLARIVEAVEGPIIIAECDDVPYCHSNPSVCVLRRVYEGANRVLREYLEAITLAELARQQETQEAGEHSDYSI
jgi:Rrf2 family iron-sulfur cluster assembly transcriptional regulator